MDLHDICTTPASLSYHIGMASTWERPTPALHRHDAGATSERYYHDVDWRHTDIALAPHLTPGLHLQAPVALCSTTSAAQDQLIAATLT
ncbi:unnamed protein product [Toxocara canis]|uniref:Type VI secretion system tip protein VgrG n=1 Tax=Toxocara canis TaxID=6265 RepID=A0A183UYI6_TOXCA|nr:unnamed protein product [Toxocara canis]